MKKILCFLSLLICASCGGSHPLTPDSSPTLTLYQGPSGSAQGVIAKYSGLEPTAFVDNGLVRIWYTSPTYIDSTYAPAGANGNVADGPNYGTAIYPFSTQNIAYMDMPVAAFVSAIQNNTPLTWSNQGMCIAGLHQSYVTLGPDGMYNLIGVDPATGKLLNWYQSTTGYPGTWSLQQSGIATFGDNGIGNTSFNWNGTGWDVYIEYQVDKLYWRVSYWTGASLGSLTRVDSDASPTMPNGTSASEVLPQQYYGKWLNFMHQATTSANTPTSLAIWDSTAKASGWSLLAYILTVDTGWSTDVPYFQGTLGNKPFNWDSQLGDPILFEYNGATYMMYETVWMELYDIPSLSVAWWNAPLSSVTAMYFSGSESDNEHKIK